METLNNTVGALLTATALPAALWTMASHFDKRNADRFSALEKQIDGNRQQIEAAKQTLRAVMPELRAELRLEICEAGGRRLIGGKP